MASTLPYFYNLGVYPLDPRRLMRYNLYIGGYKHD